MNLKTAAQQALKALEIAMKTPINEYLPREPLEAIHALRAALADTQDWDEVEALRASLREHMAEIHRLRAAGKQALKALERADKISGASNNRKTISALRTELEPVTDCHEKEGDKLPLPFERNADTGKTSDDPETNFGNMAQAVDSTEADHIVDANKIVATSIESRHVEPVAWLHEWEGVAGLNMTPPEFYGDHWKHTPLYASPPKREPLTDEEIKRLYDLLPSKYTLAMFARAIERAHGIGGEE